MSTAELSNPEQSAIMRYVREEMKGLVAIARANGLVITIEHLPEQPLAMGNTYPVIEVRLARGHY